MNIKVASLSRLRFGLILAAILLFPAQTAMATLFVGTGTVGGTFRLRDWGYGTDYYYYHVTYSGPMRVSYDLRTVEDPNLPGTFTTELGFGLSTMHKTHWVSSAPGMPEGDAILEVFSFGYVPRVLMPPGYGPMPVYLRDVAQSNPVYVLVPEVMDQSGQSLTLEGSWAENGTNVGFSFSGVEVPEPSSVTLALVGLLFAGLVWRTKRSVASSTGTCGSG